MQRSSNLSPSPAVEEGPIFHNSVLIRTHEPDRFGARKVVPILVGAALIIGAGVWAYLATHPAAPLVNHAVAAAPTSPGWSTAG